MIFGGEIRQYFAENLPLCPSPLALEQLEEYLRMLRHWNRSLNLTGFSSVEGIVRELVSDSFHLAFFLENIFPDFNGSVLDAGAGAGFPGIPLRIVWPRGFYTMVESREKRAIFLANVLGNLRLPDTEIINGRVEIFLSKKQKKFDCILSRAFKPWPELLPLFQPWLNDCLIVMASQPAPDISWNIIAQYEYEIVGKKRWFWAIRP